MIILIYVSNFILFIVMQKLIDEIEIRARSTIESNSRLKVDLIAICKPYEGHEPTYNPIP